MIVLILPTKSRPAFGSETGKKAELIASASAGSPEESVSIYTSLMRLGFITRQCASAVGFKVLGAICYIGQVEAGTSVTSLD